MDCFGAGPRLWAERGAVSAPRRGVAACWVQTGEPPQQSQSHEIVNRYGASVAPKTANHRRRSAASQALAKVAARPCEIRAVAAIVD